MEVAASAAGFIALADLVTRYSKLIDSWKDAPAAVTRIRDSLSTLKSIVARLEELNLLSEDQLLRSGVNLAILRQDMKALRELADDLRDNPSFWAKTKWALRKNEEAKELSRKLDSHVGVLNLVLALATQTSIASLETPILEMLEISRNLSAAAPESGENAYQQSRTPGLRKPRESGRVLLAQSRRSRWRACSQDCKCYQCWGIQQVRYLKTAAVAPHSRRITDTQYELAVDFMTWKTIFGQFRLQLWLQFRQQAWSLSPSITLSKQNILPEDSPIFELSRRGDFAGIIDLFRRGLASPNDRTADGETPLSYAISNNHLATALALLEEGADVISDPVQLFTAITRSEPEWGDFPLRLLERGADVLLMTAPDFFFSLSLFYNRSPRTLKALVEPIPDVDWCFVQALQSANLEAVRLLLQMGHDANTPLLANRNFAPPTASTAPSIPLSPITIATQSLGLRQFEWPRMHDVLHELLSRGANLKATVPASGFTVLHHFFLEPFASVNYFTCDYNTLCLHLVFLIDNGADPRALDRCGRSPSQAAWDSAFELKQAAIVLWYRVLRTCNLDPADLDENYDSRFDIILDDCYFCSVDARSSSLADYLLCPWCCKDAYTCDYLQTECPRWRNLSEGVSGQKIRPCCLEAVCGRHGDRLDEAETGFLLPTKSRGLLRRVELLGLLDCEDDLPKSGRSGECILCLRMHPRYRLVPGPGGYVDTGEDTDDEQEFHDC